MTTLPTLAFAASPSLKEASEFIQASTIARALSDMANNPGFDKPVNWIMNLYSLAALEHAKTKKEQAVFDTFLLALNDFFVAAYGNDIPHVMTHLARLEICPASGRAMAAAEAIANHLARIRGTQQKRAEQMGLFCNE